MRKVVHELGCILGFPGVAIGCRGSGTDTLLATSPRLAASPDWCWQICSNGTLRCACPIIGHRQPVGFHGPIKSKLSAEPWDSVQHDAGHAGSTAEAFSHAIRVQTHQSARSVGRVAEHNDVWTHVRSRNDRRSLHDVTPGPHHGSVDRCVDAESTLGRFDRERWSRPHRELHALLRCRASRRQAAKPDANLTLPYPGTHVNWAGRASLMAVYCTVCRRGALELLSSGPWGRARVCPVRWLDELAARVCEQTWCAWVTRIDMVMETSRARLRTALFPRDRRDLYALLLYHTNVAGFELSQAGCAMVSRGDKMGTRRLTRKRAGLCSRHAPPTSNFLPCTGRRRAGGQISASTVTVVAVLHVTLQYHPRERGFPPGPPISRRWDEESPISGFGGFGSVRQGTKTALPSVELVALAPPVPVASGSPELLARCVQGCSARGWADRWSGSRCWRPWPPCHDGPAGHALQSELAATTCVGG
nr:hypothetical protein CFP56_28703 [Quercus suber]